MNFKYSMFQRDASNAARSLICQSSKLHSIEIFHIKRLILQNDHWGVEVVNRKFLDLQGALLPQVTLGVLGYFLSGRSDS